MGARYSMLDSEIENAKTIYSIVVDNHRFPVDYFWIDPERRGYVLVQNSNISGWLNLAFRNNRYKNHHCSFQVWDFSRRGTRIVWHLRLIDKRFMRNKLDNEYTIFYFEYNYTYLELLVALALSKNGAKFLTQIPIGNFLVDFYIEPDIIIEIDGPYHETDEQRKRDQNRDRILRSFGFRVERISYSMLENLSLDLVSGDLLPMNSDEEQRLEDLDTRISIILAKKEIKSDFQSYIDEETELRNMYDISLYNDENSEDLT